MCSLVGWGCACRSAVQVSSIPAVQKPHWAAPRWMKASWRGSRLPPGARPSIVVTRLPDASKVRYVQALMGSPSTSTVQAPQTCDSHERFVPVRWSRSRTNSKRVSSARTSPRHGWPLIWSATGIMDPVYTALAISLPPVGPHGLGQRTAEEHPCKIRLVGHRAMPIIDRLQDLLVVALGLLEDRLALCERCPFEARFELLQTHGDRADATHGEPHLGEASVALRRRHGHCAGGALHTCVP